MRWKLMANRLGVAFAGVALIVGAQLSWAQERPAVEWTQTTYQGRATRLYTPTSGAFFAASPDGLSRSDDGGTTWRSVSLPAVPVDAPGAIVVDPTNHTVVYVVAADGIYKTDDDAASWRLLVTTDPVFSRFQRLVVSPVDPNVVYTIFTLSNLQSIRFQRSTDGGLTWDEPDTGLNSSRSSPTLACYWSTFLLQPHLSEANGLYRAFGCQARGLFVTLRRSVDGGATWQALIEPPRAAPRWLVGGLPDAPDRLIVGSNTTANDDGGYVLSRSDDNGTTWRTIEEYHEGGQVNRGPSLSIDGLAIDPTLSDRLLIGLNAYGRTGPRPVPPLRLSLDGGSSWTDVTPPDLPKINDVKFGIDGRTMFVATESGIWRAPAP
jgi:hypothetical protein